MNRNHRSPVTHSIIIRKIVNANTPINGSGKSSENEWKRMKSNGMEVFQ